jgi:hypothetical protein
MATSTVPFALPGQGLAGPFGLLGFPILNAVESDKPDHLITNTSSWSSHVETVYGEKNAPGLQIEPQYRAAQELILAVLLGSATLGPDGAPRERA